MDSSSQVIPPPPTGFDFEAPPAQVSALPPPPPGFDFEAPPPNPATLKPMTAPLNPAAPHPTSIAAPKPLPTPTTGKEIAPTSYQIGAPPPEVPKTGPLIMSTKRTPLPASYTTEPSFGEARGMAAKQVSDAVDENLPFLVGPFRAHAGIIKAGAEMATDPVNLAIMAGTAGLGAVPGVAARGLEAGLSAYFATQAGKAFLQKAPEVAHKVMQGDWQGAAESGGGALADAVMAYGAASHAIHGATALPSQMAGDIQGLKARFGPAKKVSGEVLPPIDPFQGTAQIGSQPEPITFEHQPEGAPPPEPPVAPPPAAEATPEQAPPIVPGTGPLNDFTSSIFGNQPEEALPAAQEKPQPTVNTKEFARAHATWSKGRMDAVTKFMEENPNVEYEDALKAVEGTYGQEPHPRDFKAPPPPPAPPPAPEPPPEPPKPDQVQRVGPLTPNPPTAAVDTEPESPETIALQLQQLGDGTRKVVMFPKGQGQPLVFPPGVALTHDAFKNTYAYRPDLIKKSAISTAASNNTLPEVLGGPMGMGAPDKSALQGPPLAVVGKDANGVEAQTTVTDAPSLPATIAATHAVTPVGGTVEVKPPEGALTDRTGAPALPAPENAKEVIPHLTQGQVEVEAPSLPEQQAAPAIPPPPPGFDLEKPPAKPMSDAGARNAIKRVDAALLQAAQDKAEAENNAFMRTILRAINLKNMSPADRDTLNTYLGIPEGTMVDHRKPLPDIEAASSPAGPRQPDLLKPLSGPDPETQRKVRAAIERAKYLQRQAAATKGAKRDSLIKEAGEQLALADQLSKSGNEPETKPQEAPVTPQKETPAPETKPAITAITKMSPKEWSDTFDRSVQKLRELGAAGASVDQMREPLADMLRSAGEFGWKQISGLPRGINEATPEKILDLANRYEEALGRRERAEEPAPLLVEQPEQDAVEAIPAPSYSTPVQEVQSEAFPPTLADSPADEPGHIKLANASLRLLQNGESIGNNVQFQRIADESFGGSRAAGKYDMKQAYDALEAAVNRYIADSIGPDLLLADPAYAVQQLRELMSRLPTQNIRTENQELLQQFSTPPTLSFLTAKVAGLAASDIVLEPSAGTGSLASWAKASGAIVRTNEIDPRRAELLSYAVRGSQPTSHDAEFLNSTLPAEIQPTVVLMNPPFSATGGRLSANKNSFGYRHVTEALKRLQPGGRLVAILGEGATPTAPNSKAFWVDIAKNGGTLRANVGISGKEYAKYGTTFGNRLIIVDKARPIDMVEQLGHDVQPIYGEYNTIEGAYNAVQPIIAERARSASSPVVRPGRPVRGATGGKSTVPAERGGGIEPSVAGETAPAIPSSEPVSSAGTIQGQESGTGPENIPAVEVGAGIDGDSGGSAVEPLRPDDRISLESRKKEDLLNRTEDDSSFVEYVPSIEGLAHPGRLVETKVMASVNPPPVTYTPNLPSNVKAPKPLSAAQLEAVARAGMMHQIFDESGNRQGYLMGDGTGVGKGQQIAAIIWDRNRSGQKKAIWISASKGLQKAAKGDFVGVGAKDLSEKLHSLNDWNAADAIDLKEGVVFSTYNSLVAKAKGEKGQTRLDQIKNWLGPEGVIIFDESQKGKNAVAGAGSRAVSSKTGEYVVKVQDDLPKAYVVYASATAATDVNNLGYMVRMGLWGKGTPFHQGFGHFMTEVGRGGIAAMELIAREMKSAGKYLSRSISFKGVTFDEKIHELTPEQRKTYDTAVRGWQQVLNAGLEQLKDNNAEGSRALGEFTQNYWGTHQRFFRKLLTAMKVPSVLELVDKAIDEKKSVVISLIGTGQSQADQAMASGAAEDEDDLDFSPKDSLLQMVRQSFPTTLYEEYEDEQGNVKKRPVIRNGKIVENPEAIARRDDLIDELNRELALPDNPLDFIIRNYGRENVSELTGRKKSVERNKTTGKWENVSRAPEGVPMEKINEYEMEQFQSGKKRIAIISKASGAGFSLHADLAAKNQQPRFHIVMELSWSADDQMQSFGRTHRSNQKQPPEYVILSTDAGGEKRFSSTIARRLESLGALTKGQRDASGGSSVLAKYNFETTQGEQAAQAFYQYLLNDNPTIEGTTYSGHDLLKQMGILKQRTNDAGDPIGLPTIERENMTNVTRLMNRVMNVELGAKPANHQNATFDLFTTLFDQAVQRAIENGTLDTGVNLVRGDHIRLVQAKPIAKDEASGAETFRYVVEAERKNRPVPTNVVRDLQAKGRGHMMKRQEFKGATEPDQLIWVERSRTPITNKNGTVERAYNTFGPAHREAETAHDRISESDLNLAWEPLEGADTIAEIKRLDESIPETEKTLKEYEKREKSGQSIYSGSSYYKNDLQRQVDRRKILLDKVREAKEQQFNLWQQAYDAAPKSRTERIDMIGGSVMRVWPLLKVGNGRMDIRIAYPDSGGSITGVAMTEGDANAVEQSLTGQKVVRGPGSIFEAVIRGKENFQLTGGVRLSLGRINREPVIDITTNDSNNQRFLDQIGVKKEKIGWQYRYYVPNDSAVGVPLVEKILKQFPIRQEGKPASGVYMGGGLGAFQPFMEAGGKAAAQFTREEVLPKAASIWNGARDIVSSMVNIVNPRRGVPTKTLDQIYRMNGGREAANFLMASQLDKWSGEINQMTQEQMVDFIDRQKTGKQQETDGLQNLSEFLRKTDDALYDEIAKYKPTLEYLENHYRVLWKVIPGSPQAKARQEGGGAGFRGVFRRPLLGGKGFLKQSKLADMSEGLELGGVPYSYNPVVMFMAHYSDAMKYITAQRLWEDFKKTGVRKFVKFGAQQPEGYTKLADPIAKAYFPTPPGMVDAGDWYVEDGAARLLNNMLGRDYLREVYRDTPASKLSGNFGKLLLAIKNNTTAIELAFSPFHAIFEGNEAIGSQMGIGMRELWNLGVLKGDPAMMAKGVKDILLSPAAAYTAAKHGSMAKNIFANFDEMEKTVAGRQWLKDHPEAREDIPYFFVGGGKMAVPEEFQIKAANGFKEYLNSAKAGANPGHYVSMAIRSIPAFNRAVMAPLFEKYIPNLKLGFFLKEFALAKQEYADRIQSGDLTLTELARNVVDSVENRFGEMNFDNLYWNRTFKTAAQILFRSVTWKLGNLRANIGALTGQGAEFRRAVKEGRLPTLHSNMGWFLGMSLWTAVLGSVVTMLATGKRPQQIKDLVYPVVDSVNNIRVSLPTYWRDMIHLAHDPLGYVTSSSSGFIGKTIEAWENKDFYGNEVYNPDDPLTSEALSLMMHFTPQPFGVSSFQAAKKESGNPIAKYAGAFGLSKAPRYIEQTPAERLASEFSAKHREVGSRTKYTADRAQARSGIRNIYRHGGNPQQEIADAESKGLIAPRDIAGLKKQSKDSSLRGAVKPLSLPEALKVYDAASPEEQKDLFREVRNKTFAGRSKSGEWTPQVRALAKKYFNLTPIAPRASAFASPQPIQ